MQIACSENALTLVPHARAVTVAATTESTLAVCCDPGDIVYELERLLRSSGLSV